MDSAIKVTRETEFYQGFIRFKMSVSNEASFVITDVDLDFRFDDDMLRIDRYEPSSYQKKNGKIILGNIDAGRSKSIAVLFDPLLCSKGTDINCQVTYKDAKGKFNSAFMESKTISVTCPILKTDSDINIGRLKEFIEKLPSRDSKIYEIHQGFDVPKLAGIAREVVEKHDVRHIRTLHTKDGREWEIWYYGKTKVQKDDIVIRISIAAEKYILELFAATKSAEVLTGLLAEIGRDIKQGIEFRASGKGNVINISIRDSVIQRSNLLDLCSMDGTCPINILVEDSVIQRSTLISEREKAREEERLRKEKEEQERLRRQQEEEAKKFEDIKRKAQEEADRRKKEQEREQQEELFRQREEELKKREETERERKQKEAQEKKRQEELRRLREEEEQKRKDKEYQERKLREEQERKREEKEEKTRREKEEQSSGLTSNIFFVVVVDVTVIFLVAVDFFNFLNLDTTPFWFSILLLPLYIIIGRYILKLNLKFLRKQSK